MFYAFIYGAILALGLIVPLGIQNIFIFNQGATQHHFSHAMPSVLTATLCDAILIICAVLGVSVVVLQIPWLKTVVLMLGFCFLIYMGLTSWYSRPTHLEAGGKPLSAKRQMMFAASVSLFNPHALLDTIGVIGASSLQFVGYEKWVFTAACIIISGCWFFGLSVAGHFLHRLDKSGRWLRLVNKISAVIVWGIAGYIGWLLVRGG
ncbi:MAG: LysE/ArgO family amino acid transporter [Gammaproteobacteria bacterium]|nr:LysE/ArgO family amino acid transporter [Gammaproteobacteria bacterium]